MTSYREQFQIEIQQNVTKQSINMFDESCCSSKGFIRMEQVRFFCVHEVPLKLPLSHIEDEDKTSAVHYRIVPRCDYHVNVLIRLGIGTETYLFVYSVYIMNPSDTLCLSPKGLPDAEISCKSFRISRHLIAHRGICARTR